MMEGLLKVQAQFTGSAGHCNQTGSTRVLERVGTLDYWTPVTRLAGSSLDSGSQNLTQVVIPTVRLRPLHATRGPRTFGTITC